MLTPSTIKDLACSDNLLKNPGFESLYEGWKVNAHSGTTIVEDKARTGKFSLQVNKGQISNYNCIYQEMKLKPGQYYAFGGWVKGSNLSELAYIEVADAFWEYYWDTMQFWGTQDRWEFLSSIFVPLDRHLPVKFYPIRIPRYYSGRVLIDDVFLFETKPVYFFE